MILKVGDAIGAVRRSLLLVADSLLGAMLLRSQGRAVWRRFNETLAQGRMPHREVIDGVLVIFGGAFLITPGFLTDIVGLVLLLPPTRALVRRLARAPARPARGGRAWPAALRRRGHRHRVRRRRPGGSSGERRGARALLLRRDPRALRDGAVGRDDAVRGPQAGGACPTGPRSIERAATAGAPSCPAGWRSSSSRSAPEADLGGVRRAIVPGAAARSAAARWTASGTVSETRRAAALGGARRRCAASRRWSTSGTRPARARPPPARRRGPRRRGGDAPGCHRGRAARRSRTPASRPSTTAAAASAAPASSCGCPARSSRVAAPGR